MRYDIDERVRRRMQQENSRYSGANSRPPEGYRLDGTKQPTLVEMSQQEFWQTLGRQIAIAAAYGAGNEALAAVARSLLAERAGVI